MSSDIFFSKSNIFPSIWALIIGLIAFGGGLVWSSWAGPNEVVVLNKEYSKDTTITIIHFQPDEKYFDKMNKLSSKKIQKSYFNPKKNDVKNDIDSLALSIALEYQQKIDSLRLAMVNNEIQEPKINDEPISVQNENSGFSIAQPKRPKFKMPSVVEGYTQGKINSYAAFTLNSNEFDREDIIQMKIDFFNEKTINEITPLFIDIVEQKTANSVYQIWSEQFELKDRMNTLSFSSRFKSGNYILTVGFYFLDEIDRKYPKLYSKQYDIEIK